MATAPIALDLAPAAAADLALVLTAVGVSHEVRRGSAGTEIWVAEQDLSRAIAELRRYLRENPAPPPAPPPPPRHPHAAWGALAYATVLMATSAAVLYGFADRNWVARGVLDAGLLRQGEWWRVFTALTLHADAKHLLANLLFGVLFAYPAAQFLGVGVAWLAIVLCGGIAYALDALLSPATHTVLGASTAVFVALGLASAFAWQRRGRAGVTRMQRAAPLVAGLALLAYTGAGGERTDLLAHVLGFATGALGGLALSRVSLPPPGSGRLQPWCAAVAAAILASSWAVALR